MTMTAPQQGDILAGLKIIDTDTHLSEPADLWTSRAPARYRDEVPRQVEQHRRRPKEPECVAACGGIDDHEVVLAGHLELFDLAQH